MDTDSLDLPHSELEALIQRAFSEDFVHRDLTSEACVPQFLKTSAQIVLKQRGCIAGLKFIPSIFQLCDPLIQVHLLAGEGQLCEEGTTLAHLEGPARSLLSAERTALNFLQHLSGIATLTARCVAKIAEFPCQILDTRKTLPGLRFFQKYAVRTGGGTNHRLHLGDRILIKNNHLALAPKNDLFSIVREARTAHPLGWIEVEIDFPEQLIPALGAGADALLLDNMPPEKVRECVQINQKRAYLEASGGITLENLPAYAATGVDGISIGALTHSAPALDISLRIKKNF